MIGKIKGKLIEVDGNKGLIETNSGVCYLAYLTPTLLTHNKLGSAIELYTYLQVRDDAFVLFGFQTQKEKIFFELLISVSGVGPKTAYSIISFSSEDELVRAVQNNDIDYFSRVPGLGKKTAMKIILEISQKLKTEFQIEKMYLSEEDKVVVDALISLGFRAQEARQILTKIPTALSIEEKIKEGIKLATSKD